MPGPGLAAVATQSFSLEPTAGSYHRRRCDSVVLLKGLAVLPACSLCFVEMAGQVHQRLRVLGVRALSHGVATEVSAASEEHQ